MKQAVEYLIGTYNTEMNVDIPWIMAALMSMLFIFCLFRLLGVLFKR